MANHRHIALLRGINVGGNNIIPMADLRACFADMGFTDVVTYIQSGNVVFTSRSGDLKKLTSKIEKGLSAAFSYTARVAVISGAQMAKVVAQAPTGFGTEPDTYRYDVLFVMPPTPAADAFRQLTMKPGVDTGHCGDHALYFRRLIASASSSHLSRLVALPIYRQLTIRNWNTTTRLHALANPE